MSLRATTHISLPPFGNTTTAAGSQLWLNSAHTADMATPIADRSSVDSVNELTWNWD